MCRQQACARSNQDRPRRLSAWKLQSMEASRLICMLGAPGQDVQHAWRAAATQVLLWFGGGTAWCCGLLLVWQRHCCPHTGRCRSKLSLLPELMMQDQALRRISRCRHHCHAGAICLLCVHLACCLLPACVAWTGNRAVKWLCKQQARC